MHTDQVTKKSTNYGLKVNSPFDLASFEVFDIESKGELILTKPGIYNIKCLDDIEIKHELSDGLYHLNCFSTKNDMSIKINSKGINLNSNSDIYHHVINNHRNVSVEIYSRGLCDGGKIVYRSNIESTSNSSGNGKQSGKFVILSEGSEVDAIPELENTGKEMSVSHAISVGQLNSNYIKYLNLHGYDQSQAREELINAFLN